VPVADDARVVGVITRSAFFRALAERFLADRDPSSDFLTALANRAEFESAFATEMARARRYGHPGALLLADLDGFKAINDTFGHAVGDQVLKDVARVLREYLRATDTIARLGGDEFVALLPETTPAAADAIADKLSQAIPRAFERVAGKPVTLGISVGCVCFDGSTVESPEDLLHAADRAMYEAKAGLSAA
jgi:two-component system, cell cycle response regulator